MYKKGFTIVELLIVIVIIAILAAITIVSYYGVSTKAKTTALISDISAAGRSLSVDNAINGKYPPSLSQANNGRGITSSGATTYQYVINPVTNAFCLSGVNGTITYKITDLVPSPVSGTCPASLNTFANLSWSPKTSAGSKQWVGLSSSDDGTKLTIAEQNGYIYSSADSGNAWTARTASGQRNWLMTASSSDGSKIAASTSNGYLSRSTDFGATWTQLTAAGSRSWLDIDTSSDGTKLVATSSTYIFTSSDSGATWTQRTSAGSTYWGGVIISSDGTKLAATDSNNGYFYTSSDSGATWTQRGSGMMHSYYIDGSTDGTTLIAGGGGGTWVWTSTNSGSTWTRRDINFTGSSYIMGLTVSADGTKAALVEGDTDPGYIYTSKDSGVTWQQQSSAGSAIWSTATNSKDGSQIYAAAGPDGINGTSGLVTAGLYD